MLKNLRIIDQIIPRSRPPAPIETRSLPALAHRYPRDFTFYVAAPVSSILLVTVRLWLSMFWHARD